MELATEKSIQTNDHLAVAQANCEMLFLDRFATQRRLSEYVLSLDDCIAVGGEAVRYSSEIDFNGDPNIGEKCRLISIDEFKQRNLEINNNTTEAKSLAECTEALSILDEIRYLNPHARIFLRDNSFVSSKGVNRLKLPEGYQYSAEGYLVGDNPESTVKFPISMECVSAVDVFLGKDQKESRSRYSDYADESNIINPNYMNAEIPKTELQTEYLNEVFEVINQERRAIGQEDMAIDQRSIHFIDEKSWNTAQAKETIGSTDAKGLFNFSTIKKIWRVSRDAVVANYKQLEQAIYIRQPKNIEDMVELSSHEATHADQFNSMEQRDGHYYIRRIGFECHVRKDHGMPYFRSINEAITQKVGLERSKKVLQAMSISAEQDDDIDEVVESDDSIKSKLGRLFGKRNQKSAKNDNPMDGIMRGYGHPARSTVGGYSREDRDLSRLTSLLEGPDISKEQAYEMFTDATFGKGNYMPVARLVESKLGKGSFRKLGRASVTPDGFHKFVNKHSNAKKIDEFKQSALGVFNNFIGKFKKNDN